MKKAAVWFGLLMIMAVLPWKQATANDLDQSLKKLGITHAEIKPSPAAGLKMVFTDRGIIYITDDGKYILQGPMYDISSGIPRDMTAHLLKDRLQKLEKTMIIYPAAKEKYTVTVFTDVTCGYCRKLHQEMKQYNDLGITVRYLAFPRQGLNSNVEKEMRSIWCSAQRNEAFDAAMRGDEVVPISCPIDLSQHYRTGVQFGVQGTPAMVLSDGTLLPGYQEPKALVALLQEHAKMTQAATEKK